jgi:hypothetical protein
MVLEYYINEPLSNWSIIVTEFEIDEHPGRRRFYGSYKCRTLAELHNYFMSSNKYEIGESLKYNIKREPRPKFHHTSLVGRLCFAYTDRWVTQRYEFDNMSQFVAFLIEPPVLAKAVGYSPKWAILSH